MQIKKINCLIINLIWDAKTILLIFVSVIVIHERKKKANGRKGKNIAILHNYSWYWNLIKELGSPDSIQPKWISTIFSLSIKKSKKKIILIWSFCQLLLLTGVIWSSTTLVWLVFISITCHVFIKYPLLIPPVIYFKVIYVNICK